MHNNFAIYCGLVMVKRPLLYWFGMYHSISERERLCGVVGQSNSWPTHDSFFFFLRGKPVAIGGLCFAGRSAPESVAVDFFLTPVHF